MDECPGKFFITGSGIPASSICTAIEWRKVEKIKRKTVFGML